MAMIGIVPVIKPYKRAHIPTENATGILKNSAKTINPKPQMMTASIFPLVCPTR